MSDKGTRVAGLVYLGWQCKPGQSPAEGLPEALARFQARTGQRPRALVVRHRDSLSGVDIEIVESASIAADCIGMVIEGETGQAGEHDLAASAPGAGRSPSWPGGRT